MVKARGGPAITGVQFAAAGSTSFTPIPLAGVDNVVRLAINGSISQVEASLVDAAFRKIAPLPLTADDNAGYSSRFTPKAGEFRVLIKAGMRAALRFSACTHPCSRCADRRPASSCSILMTIGAMGALRTIVAAFVIALIPTSAWAQRVTKVPDGDTVVIDGVGTVRLLGIKRADEPALQVGPSGPLPQPRRDPRPHRRPRL